MKCLIIAAGLGSRLAGKGDSKPLVKLGGIPLVERVMDTVIKAGTRDFIVITGYNGDKIKDRLALFSKENHVDIEFIHNNRWEKPNGISVHCAKDKLHEPFLLSMSDHLFDPGILTAMCSEGITGGEVKLAVDLRITDNPLVDLDDVTKVLVENRHIRDIGKTIPRYNAFDTGIFLCTPALFDALEKSFEKGDYSLSGGIRQMAALQKAFTFDIGDRNWIDIDDEAAFNKALLYFNLHEL